MLAVALLLLTACTPVIPSLAADDDCLLALKDATLPPEHMSEPWDMDAGLRACDTLEEFIAGTHLYPASLGGHSARELAHLRCAGSAIVGDTRICRSIGGR